MTTMDEDMSDTNRSRKDSVVDINGGAADCEQSAEKVESVELTAATEARRKYDEAVLSESQALEKYYDDVAEAVRMAEDSRPKKMKKRLYRPMTAEQQAASISALEKKLLEFPASPDESASSVPPTKKTKKQSPLKTATTASSRSATEPSSPDKKHKRVKKPKTPQQSYPDKGSKQRFIKDLKLPKGTLATQKLVGMLAKINPTSTDKDVQGIVDVAGDTLASNPTTSASNEEIRALLEQEDRWKEMAREADPGLQEVVKKFMERYGLIPIGALEVADSEESGM